MASASARRVLLVLTLLLFGQPLPAQSAESPGEPGDSTQPAEPVNRLTLARSKEDYPVTPGDVYRLSYLSAGQLRSLELFVQSDYQVNLNIFGTLNTENMSFPAFRAAVENLVNAAYPNSSPLITITSVGVFQVPLKGEVQISRFVQAWGLTRLSEVVLDNLEPYSSIREISVVSKKGSERHFDLFRYLRSGSLEDNPYLKPGDTVIINRRDREIEIMGEIHRPGRYQILGHEGLAELIDFYGGGLTKLAYPARVLLERIVKDGVQVYHLNLEAEEERSYPLLDGDVVKIPSRLDNLPIVTFIGLLVPRSGAESEESIDFGGEVSELFNRIDYTMRSGETLYDALQAIRSYISPFADLSAAYLIRAGEDQMIPLDLKALLYSYTPAADLELYPFDRIVIPGTELYVRVDGRVGNPGNYLFVPHKPYTYYIGRAGGIPPGTSEKHVTILSASGETRSITDFIEAQDRIIISSPLITVVGGINAPGSFPYIPAKTYEYYVESAGGFNPEMNTDKSVRITDEAGNPRSPEEAIQAGDSIYVPANSFLYNFNRSFPVVSSGLALLVTIITLVNLLAN